MFPELFSIGFLHVKTYGVCMALGFLLCWTLMERLSGRNDLSNLLVALMASGIIGSRAAYVIENWTEEFASRPWSVLRVDQGGLVFYGGLILATIVFFAWCRCKRESVLAFSDLLAAVVPLGHAFGRVGCFFYGCCYGKACGGAWYGASFPRFSPAWHEQVAGGLLPATAARSLPVIPTQLVEAVSLACLFAFLQWLYRRQKARGAAPGLVAAAYFMLYAVLRFAIEFLRGDPRAEVGPLSIAQTISLGTFALGLAFAAIYAMRTISRSKRYDAE